MIAQPSALDPVAVPPNSLEAERAVLGSVLLDREIIGRISELLKPSDFYCESHGVIFDAMVSLYNGGQVVDYLTLMTELERSGRLAAAGGFTALSDLAGAVPTPLHAASYARLVAEAACKRRLISAGGKIAALGFQGDLSADLALERGEQILLDVTSGRAAGRSATSRMPDLLRGYLDRLDRLHAGEAAPSAIPTGFLDLDRALRGGLHRSDLVVLAARPAMGKSALAMGIAAHAGIRLRAGVLVFSLEMSADQLVARLVASESAIPTARLEAGSFEDRESYRLGRAISAIAESTILIDETPALSVTEIRSRVRQIQARQPVDLVIVDHLQLIQGPPGVNRVQEVSEITRRLKALAKEQHVAVLLLSQLSRAVEQRNPKIPQLADLRDSGSVEQDADAVIFIYRDDYYDRESERAGVADLLVAKHRNGPTGQVSLLWDARTTRFASLEV